MARRSKDDGATVVLHDPNEVSEAVQESAVNEIQEIPLELELDRMADDGAPPKAETTPNVVIEYRDSASTKRMAELAQEAEDFERDEKEYKEAAKAAKASKEKAIAEMRRIGVKYNEPTMFDGLVGDGSSKSARLAASPPAPALEASTAVMDAPAKSDEAWREVSVEVLAEEHGLPKRTVDALIDAGLTTIGKVADYTNKGKLLIDLKGISDAGAEKIFDAMTEFWAANLVESAQPEADDESEDEDEDEDEEDDETEE